MLEYFCWFLLQLWYKHTSSSLVTSNHSVCFPMSLGPALVFSIGTQYRVLSIYNQRWCHFCLSLPCRAKGHLTGESHYDWELLSSWFFSPGKCIQSWALRLKGGPRQRTKKSGKSGDLGGEVIGRARIRCRLKRRVSKTTFLLWVPGEVVGMIILWTTHHTRKMNVSYLPEEEGVIDNAGTKCHLRRSLIQIVWTRAVEISLWNRLWTNCPHQQAGDRAEIWSHQREKDT